MPYLEQVYVPGTCPQLQRKFSKCVHKCLLVILGSTRNSCLPQRFWEDSCGHSLLWHVNAMLAKLFSVPLTETFRLAIFQIVRHKTMVPTPPGKH